MFLPQPLTPNFLQNERGIPLGLMGWIGSAGSIGNVVFNLLLGRMNSRPGYLLGQALVGLFAFLLWQGAGFPWYAAGYFVLGGFRAARVLGFAQVRLLVHPARMGLAYGITEVANALAMILAPLLAGLLYERSPISIYPISLGLIGLAMLLYFLLAPRGEAHPEPVLLAETMMKE
jgi:MFS family permease